MMARASASVTAKGFWLSVSVLLDGGVNFKNPTALNPINCVNQASFAGVVVDRVDTHQLGASSPSLRLISPLVIILLTLTWFNLLYVLGLEVQTFYEVAEISQ